MTFRDRLASDGVKVFANADTFGETVTYYAEGAVEGEGEEILAVIDRNPVTALGVDSGLPETVYLLSIPTSELDSVVIDSDVIDLVDEQGTTRRCLVQSIDSWDEGMWRLRVRVGATPTEPEEPTP